MPRGARHFPRAVHPACQPQEPSYPRRSPCSPPRAPARTAPSPPRRRGPSPSSVPELGVCPPGWRWQAVTAGPGVRGTAAPPGSAGNIFGFVGAMLLATS